MSKLIAWFKGLFTDSVKMFLSAVFTKARTEVISALKDIAMKAVIEANQTGLSNEEKRARVVADVKAYAISRGIEAKDSVVSLLVEMSVAALKG